MICHCKKKTCTKCNPNSIADIQAKLSEMSDTLNKVVKDTKYLSCAHPIHMIQQASDIAAFDQVTGLGSKCWDGWALCIGKTYTDSKKNSIVSPNLTDRFIVAGGGAYAVNATGGSDDVVLVINNLPVHKHAINDPGHTHEIADPGHNHDLTDPGHNHNQNAHDHGYSDQYLAPPNGGSRLTNTGLPVDLVDHAKTTDSATATNIANTTGITIAETFTGLEINPATTGISQTTDTGANTPHENRPPYYSLIFVMRIG